MANQLAAKCSYWNGGGYCDDPDSPYVDEVAELRFCEQHAGPLSMSAHDVDVYSLALRIAGEYDVAIPLPKVRVS